MKSTMTACPHCHSTAPTVYCASCTRHMCEDCISPDNLCGLCFDNRERAKNRSEAIYRRARMANVRAFHRGTE
jgi:hypothetical protein